MHFISPRLAHQTWKSYLTALQQHKRRFAGRPYIVTQLNFIGLLHYDVTIANSHWS